MGEGGGFGWGGVEGWGEKVYKCNSITIKIKILLIIIIKSKLACFKLVKSVLLVFLAAANSGGVAELFFVSDQYLASLQSSFPVASGPIGSGTHPPPGYVCTRGAFHDAHSPWCLRSQVPPNHMLPGALDLGLLPPHAPAGVLGSWVESRLELLLQNSSKCPQVSFSF